MKSKRRAGQVGSIEVLGGVANAAGNPGSGASGDETCHLIRWCCAPSPVRQGGDDKQTGKNRSDLRPRGSLDDRSTRPM
jgi:hypothetical protein